MNEMNKVFDDTNLGMDFGNSYRWMKISYVLNLVGSLLCLAGALFMWKLKKIGFYSDTNGINSREILKDDIYKFSFIGYKDKIIKGTEIELSPIIELFKEIIRTKKIDFHIISSAISIYILIGVFWYLLFMFLLMIDPDSFDIRNFNPEMVSIDMIYFSFTTLTTLGYGDITPVSYTAKMWSITEAMMGVMFLAVMISRVVSLFGSKNKN
mgnify:CR=1 FL=1